MTYFSFHTHSSFCDGKMSPESYVLQAISIGMSSIGFSSHAPLRDNFVWAMKSDNLDSYLSEIKRLKNKYKGEINIFLSLEIDYIPRVSKSIAKWKEECALDYTIGSVHLVKADSESEFWFLDGPDSNYSKGIKELFNGDVKKAVGSYYNQVIEMIKEQKPDVIGHIDKVKMNNKNNFFKENEDWYVDLLDRTLASVEESNCIVEVNTRGLYKKKSQELFPDSYFLEECYRRQIPLTISSDAHHPAELIEGFDYTIKRLKDIGFESVYIFRGGVWIAEAI
nr:histidinol-phosphatase HisJ [uncultured Marinifilum sp.]